MVFLTLLAAIITADNTKKAPKLDAIGNDQLEVALVRKKLPKRDEPKISKATPKLAPEEIPNTNGPANGFLNNVCINNPEIDSPDPTKIAVIAFGILKLNKIISQLSLDVELPDKKLTISFNGIPTEPKLIFAKNNTTSKTDKNIKCFV
jgi:hypothetical protein